VARQAHCAPQERDFGVGLWNWTDGDLIKLEKAAATFTIMNGYLKGRLTDSKGIEMLLA
jgi:hydroxypyruvate isomerase